MHLAAYPGRETKFSRLVELGWQPREVMLHESTMTVVSIRKLKQIHEATHPSAHLDRPFVRKTSPTDLDVKADEDAS